MDYKQFLEIYNAGPEATTTAKPLDKNNFM